MKIFHIFLNVSHQLQMTKSGFFLSFFFFLTVQILFNRGTCELTVAAVVGNDLANTSLYRYWQASLGLAEGHQIPCFHLGPCLAPICEIYQNRHAMIQPSTLIKNECGNRCHHCLPLICSKVVVTTKKQRFYIPMIYNLHKDDCVDQRKQCV